MTTPKRPTKLVEEENIFTPVINNRSKEEDIVKGVADLVIDDKSKDKVRWIFYCVLYCRILYLGSL